MKNGCLTSTCSAINAEKWLYSFCSINQSKLTMVLLTIPITEINKSLRSTSPTQILPNFLGNKNPNPISPQRTHHALTRRAHHAVPVAPSAAGRPAIPRSADPAPALPGHRLDRGDRCGDRGPGDGDRYGWRPMGITRGAGDLAHRQVP